MASVGRVSGVAEGVQQESPGTGDAVLWLFPPQLVMTYKVHLVLKDSSAWQRWWHPGSVSFALNFS